jgi:DNA-binding CsgD family transcriptional regulator
MKRGKKPFTIDLLVQRGRIPETWKEDILEIGASGKAEVSIVKYMGISWNTHKRLLERSPEYLKAVHSAQVLSEEWWMEIARKEWIEGNSKNINSNHWSLIMRNQFKDRWSDRKDVDVTTKGDKIGDNQISVEIIKKEIEDDNSKEQ